MNVIEQMKEEHDRIKEMLEILDKFSEQLENNEVADMNDGAAMVEFFQIFADKFHHEKEERLIFPLLEKLGVPRAGGPIEIMLEDHEQGRTHVRKMAEVLEQADNAEAIDLFAEQARDYIYLMTEHIKVEDDAIFDMAEMRFSPTQMEELAAEFAMVEKITLGSGKREELYLFLERLKEVYLS